MHCFIYKSAKKDELYLYLRDKDDFSVLPAQLFADFGRLSFVMELELNAERKLAREDVQKVMAGLLNNGFFIQMPPMSAAGWEQSGRNLH